jgi:hypothetical protein
MPLPPALEWVMRPVADYALTDAAGPETLSGTIVVQVRNLPLEMFPTWFDINPRNPRKTKISQAIRETLTKAPETMLDRNLGIWASIDRVEERDFKNPVTGKTERLPVAIFVNPKRHGILNGGNTYQTCVEMLAEAVEAGINLDAARINIHVRTGLSEKDALDMADALNKTVQVKETSLMNQAGSFDSIKRVMMGHPGADVIQYHEGGAGSFSITKVLMIINAFNCKRYTSRLQPMEYSRTANSVAFYRDDIADRPSPARLVTTRLPEILSLMNKIEKRIPAAWERDGSKFVYVEQQGKKTKGKKSIKKHVGRVKLPFIGEEMRHAVPWGITYPILAAYRANVKWDLDDQKFDWHVDPNVLLSETLDGLVEMFKEWYKNALSKGVNVFTDLTRDNPQTFQSLYGEVQNHLLQRREARATHRKHAGT